MQHNLPTAEGRSDEWARPLVTKGLGKAMTGDTVGTPQGWRFAWCLVFLLNLIVPLMFAWLLCGTSGRIGLIPAVLAYGGFGLYACDGRSRWRRALVYGGGLMALSQMFPALQIFAGGVGVSAWSALTGQRDKPLSGPGGFFVTGVTGGLLLGCALLCGLVVDWMFHRSPPRSKPDPAPWDEF